MTITEVKAISANESVARIGECGTLPSGRRYLVNAGSVGQPRDRDPRASYVIYDTASTRVEVRRAVYPVEKTQKRMRTAGIPAFLIDRLGAGV